MHGTKPGEDGGAACGGEEARPGCSRGGTPSPPELLPVRRGDTPGEAPPLLEPARAASTMSGPRLQTRFSVPLLLLSLLLLPPAAALRLPLLLFRRAGAIGSSAPLPPPPPPTLPPLLLPPWSLLLLPLSSSLLPPPSSPSLLLLLLLLLLLPPPSSSSPHLCRTRVHPDPAPLPARALPTRTNPARPPRPAPARPARPAADAEICGPRVSGPRAPARAVQHDAPVAPSQEARGRLGPSSGSG